MKEVTLKDLLEAGCHFGHQTTRWNPKMRPYIYTARDGIHIFDLVKTKVGLEEAATFAKLAASQNKKIIYVGTKRQAQDIVKEAAKSIDMPYMTERWIGGLITNWEYLKKRLEHLRDLKAGVAENRFKDRTKKERLLIDREIVKLMKDFGGIEDLMEIPAAIFVADAKKDLSAIKEAYIRGVKIIAICDTNSSPDFVDFVIPANDDAAKSIKLIIDTISEAITEGKKEIGKATEVKAEDKKEVEAEKVVVEKEKKEVVKEKAPEAVIAKPKAKKVVKKAKKTEEKPEVETKEIK